jgi:predicted AlkP superfamily phosphohydrolase/phosphomutase
MVPAPANHPRLLVVGFDAAEIWLIKSWSEAGLMPTFARLFADSLHGELSNANAIYTGSVWPSIFTGVNAGRHGTYFARQFNPRTYRDEPFTGEQTKAPAFWDRISAAGRRLAIVDVPKCAISPQLNGLHIVNWGLHDPEGPVDVAPPHLKADIVARYGNHWSEICDDMVQARGIAPLRRHLLGRIENKTALAKEIMARECWDLMLLGFADSHCAGHQLWHTHDPACAGAGEPAEDGLDLIREIYLRLDRALGDVLAAAGADTPLLCFTSHGMDTHFDATDLLDDVLMRLEQGPAVADMVQTKGLQSRWQSLPVGIRMLLRPIIHPLRDRLFARARSRRRFFQVVSNSNAGCIRINLKGREAAGVVDPADYDRVLDQLERDLAEIVDTETGRPIVREVVRTKRLCAGEALDDLPDLLVRWTREKPVTSVSSARIGVVTGHYTGPRTGDHRPTGYVWCRRPGLAPGVMPGALAVEAIAATCCRAVGVSTAGFEAPAIEAFASALAADVARAA